MRLVSKLFQYLNKLSFSPLSLTNGNLHRLTYWSHDSHLRRFVSTKALVELSDHVKNISPILLCASVICFSVTQRLQAANLGFEVELFELDRRGSTVGCVSSSDKMSRILSSLSGSLSSFLTQLLHTNDYNTMNAFEEKPHTSIFAFISSC